MKAKSADIGKAAYDEGSLRNTVKSTYGSAFERRWAEMERPPFDFASKRLGTWPGLGCPATEQAVGWSPGDNLR